MTYDFFSKKIRIEVSCESSARFDISCESSARQRIHMELQALFSLKNKSKKIKESSAAIFVDRFKGEYFRHVKTMPLHL